MTEQATAKKPAVILARVSDPNQKDGYSPDAQLANSHAYAERKNMNVVRSRNSNFQEVSLTSTSSWRVYQFRHDRMSLGGKALAEDQALDQADLRALV